MIANLKAYTVTSLIHSNLSFMIIFFFIGRNINVKCYT